MTNETRPFKFLWKTFQASCLMAALWLAACSGAGSTSEIGLAAPILQASQSPEDVVKTFLDAWKAVKYEDMYAALSPQSQSAYAFPVFKKSYEDAAGAISLSAVDYSITGSEVQGASAAITYDASFESPVFGTIDDAGRTMRVVQKPGGWGVAWSSMDIFDGLAAGSRLEVFSRRQPRGTIYDRNGKPLVEPTGTLIPVYAAQNDMPDVAKCLDLLADVLMKQRYDLVNYFAPYAPETLFFLGAIDAETEAARGQELRDICGAKIYTDSSKDVRHYVLGGGAVHVTGYVGQIPAEQLNAYTAKGYATGDLVGLSGIEEEYEDVLSGQAEKVLRITSSSGVTLRELAGKQGTDPQSVTLTIDRDLQEVTAKALVSAFNYAENNWAAPGISPGAGAVVIDVKTGAILALASYPFFDPNIFNPDSPIENRGAAVSQVYGDERQPLRDRAIQEQYFPGSTFKIITLSAALSEKVMPEPTFYCDLTWDGRVKYGDTASPRFDWRHFEPADSKVKNAAGDLTPPQALTASCNPFFYEMGARLFNKNPDALVGYARQLGLGSATGIDPVFGEASGSLPSPTAVEQGINEAIGQGGIQVTILQMARMVASIANNGTLYKPFLVQKVGGDNGAKPIMEAAPVVVGDNGLSDTVMATVRQGMCAVTTDTNIGTAYFDFYDTNFTTCGKTGTAQSGRREPYGWFVAFAPADNPQIAVAVMVEFSREGSETAGPIARRILDGYFGQKPYPFPGWWYDLKYVPLEIPDNATGG
ncbi:MAG: penicillin-binding transpeptidase domain-containing protein [Chloroflexota bacterium]